MTWSRDMSHLSKNFNFYFLTPHCHKFKNASFWCIPDYNWISGYRVMNDLSILKTKKGIWTLFLPISQKQHGWHSTHSSWSCHICITLLLETSMSEDCNQMSIYPILKSMWLYTWPCGTMVQYTRLIITSPLCGY